MSQLPTMWTAHLNRDVVRQETLLLVDQFLPRDRLLLVLAVHDGLLITLLVVDHLTLVAGERFAVSRVSHLRQFDKRRCCCLIHKLEGLCLACGKGTLPLLTTFQTLLFLLFNKA
jgi:hypothetical protein